MSATALQSDVAPFAAALADDLELLAILHDREPTADVIAALKACPFAEQLSLCLTSPASATALEGLAAALDDIPSPVDAATLDTLAAGYADVYLRHGYRASPVESVWLSEDGLERQAPMLVLRAEHRRHGVRLADPAGRVEDHLVPQLRFLAHLTRSASSAADLVPVARLLDAHLLRWIHHFAARLVKSGAPPLYSAFAVVTACWHDEARAHLARLTGVARLGPQPLPFERKAARQASEEDRPFLPGCGPTW